MSARIVIAGTSSGAGKTSIACGLIGALRDAGHVVQGCKVGPDYIDPSYHALASGRPGRNLDAFMSGPELVPSLLARDMQGADVTVIEGVMGLFDGASGRGELASTAHVAKLTGSPVVLVVGSSSMARSAAAVVHGFATFDPDVDVAGVILNNVGSDHHEQLLRDAIEPMGIPVLGAVRRNKDLATPERHLGLVPAGEQLDGARAALASLAEAVRTQVDLEAVLRVARSAEPLDAPAWIPPTDPSRSGPGPRIAVAGGAAFSFHYRENLESLESLGAELVPFDPARDEALPEAVDGLLLAGGFPEVYAQQLGERSTLRAEIAERIAAGMPTIGECGGLLYLCEQLDGAAMCGAIPAEGRMAGRLSLGYREAETVRRTPYGPPGTLLRGHEFHYSAVEPPAGAVPSHGPAFTLRARGTERLEGYATDTLLASYLHVHWAAFPELPRSFVTACREHRDARLGRAAVETPGPAAPVRRAVVAPGDPVAVPLAGRTR